MNDAKHFLASKTLWVNGLTLFVAVGMEVTSVVPANWQPALLASLAIGNILLRFATGQPITLTKEPKL